MCLKYFSQDTESFPVEYRVWKSNFRRLSQKCIPEIEAGDSYTYDSYKRKLCMASLNIIKTHKHIHRHTYTLTVIHTTTHRQTDTHSHTHTHTLTHGHIQNP